MKVNRKYLINEYKRTLMAGLTESESFCLYIHNPFCCNVCSYCMFHPINLLSNTPQYKEYYDKTLPSQLDEIAPLVKIKAVDKIYFGGGTASIMKPSFISLIQEKILRFREIPQKEAEINPNHVSPYFLNFIKENNFTHLSLGIQSFDQETLDGVNRKRYSPEQLKQFIYKLRDLCPDAYINIDLMAFLKDQTPEGAYLILEDLEILKNLSPDGISVYPNYNVVIMEDEDILHDYIRNLRKALNQFTESSCYSGYPDQLSLNKDKILAIPIADYLLFKGSGFGCANAYDSTGFFTEFNKNQITLPLGAQSKSLYGFIRDKKYLAANKDATEFEIIKKQTEEK